MSGSQRQAICKPPGWMESFDIQAFIQEQLLGGQRDCQPRRLIAFPTYGTDTVYLLPTMVNLSRVYPSILGDITA